MPARLVREEVRNHDLDLDDEEARTFRARRFQVRTAAMTHRLTNLGLLRYSPTPPWAGLRLSLDFVNRRSPLLFDVNG
jgi:hypothetical protein